MRACCAPLLIAALANAPALAQGAEGPKTEAAAEAPKPEEPQAEVKEPEEPKPAPADTAPEAPKPDVAASAAAAATPTAPPPAAAAPADPCAGRLVCFANDVVALWPKLRVRTGYQFVEADPDILYVGQNDGFFIDQARLGAEGSMVGGIGFKLTVEAASLLPGAAPNAALTPLVGALRDAFVSWTPSPWLSLQAGQQYLPADWEGGDVEPGLPFSSKSILSSGVRAGHGIAVAGLSPPRQVGVVVGSAPGAEVADVGLEYRLGLANGNGLNQSGNDNKWPAAFVRVGAGFAGDLVKVGIGGRYNPRTTGTLPNLYTEADAVGFGDVALAAAGAELVLTGVFRQTALATLVPDPANPAGQESAAGMMGTVAYDVALPDVPLLGAGWRLKPALRSAFYDPSSSFQTDQLLETTLGVRLSGPADLPAALFLDGTLLTELGDVGAGVVARDLSDNRVTLLFQWEL
ncbi:MAG: hypothetical protein A2138_26485 [Deltaproteobacteria bacterium RBG_16_71_12]|nr:MAG: hypothetical protein A2138_26485 [Deltaproteobacteria bacterium RBG_16_71_12]